MTSASLLIPIVAVKGSGVSSSPFKLRVMSVGITKLPPELLLEIIRNLDVSGEDLCQLRSVNSTFNTLTTPTIFGSTFVSNGREDAERFRALLNTPHIARHVQSIIYDESTLR